jgi:hypothetical protein
MRYDASGFVIQDEWYLVTNWSFDEIAAGFEVGTATACGTSTRPLPCWPPAPGSAGGVTYTGSGLFGGTGLGGRGGRLLAVGDDVDVDAERTRLMDNPS